MRAQQVCITVYLTSNQLTKFSVLTVQEERERETHGWREKAPVCRHRNSAVSTSSYVTVTQLHNALKLRVRSLCIYVTHVATVLYRCPVQAVRRLPLPQFHSPSPPSVGKRTSPLCFLFSIPRSWFQISTRRPNILTLFSVSLSRSTQAFYR